jgi:hypothetical protein
MEKIREKRIIHKKTGGFDPRRQEAVRKSSRAAGAKARNREMGPGYATDGAGSPVTIHGNTATVVFPWGQGSKIRYVLEC